MEYILYISRFLYRIRWQLLIGTVIITFAVHCFGKRMIGKAYNVEATLYTGAASGYNLGGENDEVDWVTTQGAIGNLMNTIKAESTFEQVSIRLYTRGLIKGSSKEDSEFTKASNCNRIYEHLKNSPNGKEILSLIDKNSEDRTVVNFFNYLRPTQANYLYGIFYYNLPYYSYNDLRTIGVVRKGASNLTETSYTASDPDIAYSTIDILTKGFVNKYGAIRCGETDKVIGYLRSELRRIGKKLRLRRDSLTQYNVEKRVINYYDKTKEITAISKESGLREQNVLIAYNSAKVILNEPEKQVDSSAKRVINNLQLLDKLNEAVSLTEKISEMETVSNDRQNQEASLQEYRNHLNQTRKGLSELSNKYIENKYTREGIAGGNIVKQWLEVTMQYEKTKSDLQIIQQSHVDFNEKYRQLASIGSTVKRQERNIAFIEQSYLFVLKSYNDALMRRKNLEMASAALKMLNAPVYPISAMPTPLKKMVMAACAGTFLFISEFSLTLESLDRTLRDSARTRCLIGPPMLGAFPKDSILGCHNHVEKSKSIATKQLSNSILCFYQQKKKRLPYIISFISTEGRGGKGYVIKALRKYWNSIGLKTKVITWKSDFKTDSREYSLAKSITDLYTSEKGDILIVEYPNLQEASILLELLQEANLDILVARVDRGWKETDKLLSEKLGQRVGKTPLYVYLIHTSRNVVEDYTGVLPPYTLWRKIVYRLLQLALTESISASTKRKKQPATLGGEDDG